MPPRLIAATAPAAMQADASSYSLDLLADYAQTLDSLPLDLSRIFADLRELDAVLTSTVTSLTSKIYKLIELIETRSVSSEERLWLLGEIADEAQKVRPGAEDKIRIATTAADELRGQSSYLNDLVTALPEFQSHLLVKKTTYPHVSAKAYLMPTSFETGRRRRAQNTASAGGWLGVADGSPNKKRRVLQEEDLDYAGGKSPRKEKTGDGSQQRPRGGPRPKKTDRIPSPSDSLRSMQSPMPGVNVANTGGQRNGGAAQRAGQGGSSKRRPNNQNGDNGSLLDSVLNRKENAHGHPPSSSHPSLPKSEHNAQNHESGNNHGRNNHGHSHSGRSGNNNGDASGAVDQHPDGLGVSGARASTQSSLTTNLEHMHDSPAPGGAAATPATVVGDGLDGDGEADNDDNKTYCYCENVSYGEMIGCDGDQCTREWFHLACVGLTATPKGQWYCDECMAKRKQRNNKNGKKRAGGGGRANQRGNGV